MANWTNPTVDSNYITFVDEVKNRDIDNARMFDGTPAATNIPSLTIRWNQANNRFERWSGTVWEGRTIGVSGGGTGATTPGGARTALGLGSIATQATNAVSITGGSITGVSFSGTGTLLGNANTATTWATAQTLTIGATGKSVNGSANVTWTAAEIGTSANTGSTLVTRNASGGFSAGTITATFSGNGSAVTNLNASNLTSGTVNAARLPSTVPLEQSQTVNNPTGGGNILFTKQGTIVTARITGWTHSSSTGPFYLGLIPPGFRPPAIMTFAASVVNNALHRLSANQNGDLTMLYIGLDGVNKQSTFFDNTVVVWNAF